MSRRKQNRSRGLRGGQIRSESFRQHQIIQMPQNHVCLRCNTEQDGKIMFCWTSCNHWYCIQCTFQVINESLSILNVTPKCIAPECNQSLDILHAQSIPIAKRSSLLPKYKESRGNMHIVSNYHRVDSLVAGYIRMKSRWNHFPDDVVLMIFDYFNLVFYTKIGCQFCTTLRPILFTMTPRRQLRTKTWTSTGTLTFESEREKKAKGNRDSNPNPTTPTSAKLP